MTTWMVLEILLLFLNLPVNLNVSIVFRGHLAPTLLRSFCQDNCLPQKLIIVILITMNSINWYFRIGLFNLKLSRSNGPARSLKEKTPTQP